MLARPHRLLGWLLLLGFVAMAASASRRVGITFDEPAHVTAGRAYWAHGDFRLHPENGLFPQRWMTLPATWAGTPVPSPTHAAFALGDVWGVARDYLFSPGAEPARIVGSARIMITLLGAALAACAWQWSTRLWGRRGGLVTLVLAVFCPHLLAHAGLATSDIAASLAFLLTLAAGWRLIHGVTPRRIVLTGLAAGLLALAKFSAVLMAPVALGLLLVRAGRRAALPVRCGRWRTRLRGWKRWPALLAASTAAAALAWVVLWAGFGFRYSADAAGGPSQFAQSWDEVLITSPRQAGFVMADGSRGPDGAFLQPGIVQRFVTWARASRLLPEAYLYGFAFTDRFARHRLAYFAGEFRESGWRTFFPAAFALKTTLPALALVVLALVALRRDPRRAARLYRLAPLLLFAAVYAAFAVGSNLNIGHRHLLPLYPVLYVLAGAAATFGTRRAGAAVVLALLGWHAVESVRVHPHYLTYFNALAGGPARGHRYFVDSSLDWGQGLPDLHRWLAERRNGEPVHLSYFGTDDPRRFDPAWTRFGDIFFDHTPGRPPVPELRGGWYCVSATMLRRVYTQVRGPWTEGYEAAYQRLRHWAQQAPHWPDGRPRGEAGEILSAAEINERLARLEQLRFGRLCRVLERREPAALVANSIFIYHLTAAEVNFALEGPLAAP